MAHSILLLEGDAEARLLADAGAVLPAVLPIDGLELIRAWAPRPDQLDAAAQPPPDALRRDGLLAGQDPRALLDQSHRLVIFALLPAFTVPALRHREGGVFLPHAGLAAQWTAQQAQRIAAECTAEPPLEPADAARALEPVIERLLDAGTAVAVCVGFRHVSETPLHPAPRGVADLRERIRRGNLEVARLSQRTGCFVLDLDRPLAQEGGATLQADCFGGSGRAGEIALDEFAALVLDALPDALLEDA